MNNFIKERDFGEVMSDTFNFFIKEFKVLFKVLLFFIGPFILIDVYLVAKYQELIEEALQKIIINKNFDNFPMEYFFMFIVGIIQNLVLMTVIASYIKLRTTKNSKDIELLEIWNLTSNSFLNVTFGQILIFVVVFIGSFLIALSGNVGFSLLLIIIWAAYVMVSMYLLTFIIVFEQKSFSQSLSRTLFLAKKNRWFILGNLIVFALIIGMSNLLITFIIGKIITIISTGFAANILSTILTSLVSVALSSILAILPAFLYASFVAKKEDSDLIEKINKIDSEENEKPE